MTQPTQSPSENSKGSEMTPAIAQLRATLQSANENTLAAFLQVYALGFAADQFISAMNQPGQRVEFLVAIAQTYPNDWKEAVLIAPRLAK
jgi:hypothetical protein